MKSMMKTILAILALLFLIAWSDDPGVNTPICDAVGNQNNPQIIPDGVGGAFVVWHDYRNGDSNADIYAQKIDTNGNALWELNGIPICDAKGNQLNPRLISDGAGGAIITWMDFRRAIPDIYAQRISPAGTKYWSASGLPICKEQSWQGNPQIIPSGIDGAIIAWTDRRRGRDDIYAQRINSRGRLIWVANGMSVCTVLNDNYMFVLVTDGAKGALIFWTNKAELPDEHYYGNNFRGQRIDLNGIRKWKNRGAFFGGAIVWGNNMKAISDGAGGAVVTISSLYFEEPLHAKSYKINPKGQVLWHKLLSSNNPTGEFGLTLDRAHNICFVDDHEMGYNLSFYKVTQEGLSLNFSDLLDGYNYMTRPLYLDIIPDSMEGLLIIRTEGHSYGFYGEIYVNRIDSSGINIWPVYGVLSCSYNGEKSEPLIIPDLSGGAITVWADNRTGDFNIYAQKVYANGTLSEN